MEIELKLALDPAANDTLRRHPLLAEHADGGARDAQLLARYFDTSDFYLRQHGAGLRVRKVDGEWIQTMKAGGGVQAGLHARNEWEGPVARAWPNLNKLRKIIDGDGDGGADWSSLLDAPGLAERLQAQFAVRVERTTWDLHVDGAAIEMVLDVGAVEHNSASDPINEIELELKSGQPETLYRFALQLLEDLPLRLENSNKAERGYALCSQSGTSVHKADELALDADGTLADAMLAIFHNCLEHIQRNEAGVIHSDNAESVHQMRVGVRRLRSALKLFDASAPCPPELVQDIEWLGGELGGARDWDVLSTSTLQRASQALAASKQVMALQTLMLERVRAQRRLAVAAITSARYTRLLLSLAAWLIETAAGSDALQQPVRGYARATVKRKHQKLLQRGARIADANAELDAGALHRTRIAGKQARYALEFFQSLYRSKRVRPYLAALSNLQDELGRHNDLVVADRLLEELEQEQPAQAGAIAFVRGYLLAQQGSDQPEVRKAWKAFQAQDVPGPS